jgi:hypothetical protein
MDLAWRKLGNAEDRSLRVKNGCSQKMKAGRSPRSFDKLATIRLPRFCEDLFSRDFREAALDGREYLVFWREEFSKSLLRSDEMLPR